MKKRNIAIIAHVDHGKTTLIDQMLGQSGSVRENQHVDERAMDSNDLEKERGITILAKCTSVPWGETRINIIDTPGHADFGGEVERILDMVDGVVLLVDAAEGPMPQTKFVLAKALAKGLRPMVVVNKIDKSDARPDWVLNEVFDLFALLDATEEQLDFPVLYASGRAGWCTKELDDPRENLKPLFELVMTHVSEPIVTFDTPFAMLATLLSADPYLGRMLTGKIYRGRVKVGDTVKSIDLDGKTIESARLTKLLAFDGLKKVPVESAEAGDIVAIAGLAKTSVAHTICAVENNDPIDTTPVDPPTMSVSISVNNSPYAGQEGKKVTSRLIRDRLMAEAETNVAITLTESANGEAFEVGGRGELQLGVLIETMRREGFELSVSRPRVLYRTDEKGAKLEPFEEVLIDIDEEYAGTVMEKVSERKGLMQDMQSAGHGKTRLVFHVPSRGLIGYQSEFLSDTRGTGVINRVYHDHRPFVGPIPGRRNGVLISTDQGEAVAYALFNLQDRGTMFVSPQDKVYQGMIVGENTRPNDMDINILKGKQLTNVRASGTDEAVRLIPPKTMTLEAMMAYIAEDELVEVTPISLRLRKTHLLPHERKKSKRT